MQDKNSGSLQTDDETDSLRHARRVLHEVRNGLAAASASIELVLVLLRERGEEMPVDLMEELRALASDAWLGSSYAVESVHQELKASNDRGPVRLQDRYASAQLIVSPAARAGFVHMEGLSCDCSIAMGKLKLTQVLVNVLHNAVRHAGKNGRVRVHLEEDSLEVKLHVLNSGEPLSVEHTEDLFSPGVSGVGSSGMGLDIVRAHLREVGGSATFLHSGEGAHLVLTLPLA